MKDINDKINVPIAEEKLELILNNVGSPHVTKFKGFKVQILKNLKVRSLAWAQIFVFYKLFFLPFKISSTLLITLKREIDNKST